MKAIGEKINTVMQYTQTERQKEQENQRKEGRLTAMVAKLEQQVAVLSQPQKCHGCGQEGHMAAQCPQKAQVMSQPLRCFNCNQEGHFAVQCPQPRRKDQNSLPQRYPTFQQQGPPRGCRWCNKQHMGTCNLRPAIPQWPCKWCNSPEHYNDQCASEPLRFGQQQRRYAPHNAFQNQQQRQNGQQYAPQQQRQYYTPRSQPPWAQAQLQQADPRYAPQGPPQQGQAIHPGDINSLNRQGNT